MIINYDKNPALTEDQKLQSLVDSIMLALNELQDRLYRLEKAVERIERNQ